MQCISYLLPDRKPCSIEWRYTGEGELVRVSTRSGRIIPKSPAWEETYDYAKKNTYKRMFHLSSDD